MLFPLEVDPRERPRVKQLSRTLECPGCQNRMRILAAIHPPEAKRKIKSRLARATCATYSKPSAWLFRRICKQTAIGPETHRESRRDTFELQFCPALLKADDRRYPRRGL